MRQIAVDTETTGLRVEEGHRVIEIGCIEMVDRKFTGKHFHYYLNPGREVDKGALAIHGITNEFLQDKPSFATIAKELVAFIKDAELIIHNAPFDLGFLNQELMMTNLDFKTISDYCAVTDTLQLARKLHVGQRNNLDALCKRYGVDNTKRDYHGALLDANLLALVYLAMTGGQGSFFDGFAAETVEQAKHIEESPLEVQQKYHLTVLNANEAELAEHKTYLAQLKARGKCVWESE